MADKGNHSVRLLTEDELNARLVSYDGQVAYAILNEGTSLCGLRSRMDDLYDSMFADVAWLRMYDPCADESRCCKLLIYSDGSLKHIFLFKHAWRQRKIEFLNYFFEMSLADIEMVSTVIFKAITRAQRLTFPYLYVPDAENRAATIKSYMLLREGCRDMVIQLPDTMDDYMMALSTKLRQQVRNSQRRLQRDFPDFAVTFRTGADIRYEDVCRLKELNMERMHAKDKVANFDADECNRLYSYAQERGMTCICTAGGKVTGGTLNFVFRKHSFGHLIAHDDAFKQYDPGRLASIQTITYLIEHRSKWFYTGSGTADYKARLQASEQVMHDVLIYRRRIPYLLNGMLLAARSSLHNLRKRMVEVAFLKKIYRKIRRACS